MQSPLALMQEQHSGSTGSGVGPGEILVSIWRGEALQCKVRSARQEEQRTRKVKRKEKGWNGYISFSAPLRRRNTSEMDARLSPVPISLAHRRLAVWIRSNRGLPGHALMQRWRVRAL